MFQNVLTHNETNDIIYVTQKETYIKVVIQVYNSKEVAGKLKKLRYDKQLTQAEVAKCLGISVSAITNYELGVRIPRDEIKIRLAKFYGKSVSDIFF